MVSREADLGKTAMRSIALCLLPFTKNTPSSSYVTMLPTDPTCAPSRYERAKLTPHQFEGTGVDHLCRHVGMSRRNQKPTLARGKPECWGWLRADVEGVAASGKAVIRRDRDVCVMKRPRPGRVFWWGLQCKQLGVRISPPFSTRTHRHFSGL